MREGYVMIEAIFFYTFSAVLITGAAMVISAKNPVHSVLYLILCFFNAAGLFVMLGAEFIAMLLVIVYVGAVAVLFLFVVMMLDIGADELKKQVTRTAPVGSIVGGILLAQLLFLYTSWSSDPAAAERITRATPNPAEVPNTHALGHVLYTHYVYLFQVSGLILLVAMIGAITLTHRQRGGIRRQSVSKQINRRPQDVVKIEKIESGAGVS